MDLKVLLILLFTVQIQAQFPELANSIFGPTSMVRGVKNVIGGVLALDSVHSQCMQKTLCSEFADEIIEASAEIDPVKRSWVFKPKVVQKRGRLRWIGDIFANTVSKIARKMGIAPSNRRQSPGFLGALTNFASAKFSEIPLQSLMHVMDFIVDATNVMERRGAVYPFVRASTLGYGYGHQRNDDLPEGICTQIAEDCAGWWDHLETVNNYDGGSISRRIGEEPSGLQRDGGGSVDQSWNFMETKDIFEPRVFLCKAGRFLENLNGEMGGEGVVKERFGSDEFQQSCRLNEFQRSQLDEENNEIDNSPANENDTEYNDDENDAIVIADEGLFPEDEVEVINAKNDSGIHDLPVLVFEGLPEPSLDQSEEDLVEFILQKTVDVPKSSVRTALRLPIKQSNGKSLVIVEMDTIENEEKVLKKRSEIRRETNLDHVGIRQAKYKELWRLVEELAIAKRVIVTPDDDNQEEENTTIVNEEIIIEEKDSPK